MKSMKSEDLTRNIRENSSRNLRIYLEIPEIQGFTPKTVKEFHDKCDEMNRIENKANDVLISQNHLQVSVCQRNIDCVKGNHGSLHQTGTQTKRMKSSDPLEDLDKSSAKSEDCHEIHEIRGLYSRNPR